jgi:ABC-type transporter Mla subunit MlaD
MNGQGRQTGEMLSNMNSILGQVNPSLAALSHEFEVVPDVPSAYADAAPNPTSIAASAVRPMCVTT